MDEELPAISALRDEESPPPQDSTTFTRFRIKLPRRSNPVPNQLSSQDHTEHDSSSRPPTPARSFSGREAEHHNKDDEAEEDQLIDDDDLAGAAPSPSKSTQSAPKLSALKKPRVRKSKAAKDKDAVFMVSTFEVTPAPPTHATTTEESWAPIQTFVPSAEAKPVKRKVIGKKEKSSLGRHKKTRYLQYSFYFVSTHPTQLSISLELLSLLLCRDIHVMTTAAALQVKVCCVSFSKQELT